MSTSLTPPPAARSVSAEAISLLPHPIAIFDESNRLVIANERFRTVCHIGADRLRVGRLLENLLEEIATVDLGAGIRLSHNPISSGGSMLLIEECSDSAGIDDPAAESRSDPLTGLLDRGTFTARLEDRLAMLGPNEELAVLYIDLDDFKPVNDAYGHAVGDGVLREAARRLAASIRIDGGDIIGRLGGDEFAILQLGGRQPLGASRLAGRITEALAPAVDVDGLRVHVGASVGIAVAPYDGQTAGELLVAADLAMYSAKDAGGGAHNLFEPSMAVELQRRRSLEAELRRAVELEQFEMHYQPILDLHSDQVIGFEGLVRWTHSELGRVGPDRFIPLAEETKLIIPLGEWILRKACQDAVSWPQPLKVAVNLSAVQLADRTLASTVEQALRESGLPPERLEVEITETALLQETDLALGNLYQLRELGVQIALDDFGTGYSSINYLRRFAFDKIKIDRSFVSGPEAGQDGEALVRMIASLGEVLGCRTTAEGVETSAECESVRSAGVTEIQGYYLSRPVPASDVGDLLRGG